MAQRPDRFPVSQINSAMSFLQHVKARFAENVYDEFLRLLQGVNRGADRREVTDRVYEFLQGHPDLVRRFDACFTAPEPAREE